MKIEIYENYEQMSKAAANVIADIVKRNPQAVLGLATGSTPVGAYRELIGMCASGELSFKKVKTVNLDEYVGLGAESGQSYVTFMKENLFSSIDIQIDNTHIPDGTANDLEKACAEYTALLRDNPRDLQLLGLGSDGHIGFNEPGAPFSGHTHVTELAESTVSDNARLFNDESEVPRTAITMGIADIMQSQKVLLLASGANKAQAVRDMVKGEVSETCPASILQRHPDALIILDKEAAKLL